MIESDMNLTAADMITLSSAQASCEIHKLAHALEVINKALDRLWPKLPLVAMQRLDAVRELELITPTLAQRVRAVADDLDEQAAEHDA